MRPAGRISSASSVCVGTLRRNDVEPERERVEQAMNSVNALRLPFDLQSPEVIACSSVISLSWMRSSVALVRVMFASAFGEVPARN